MENAREKIFHLITTADNFLKYSTGEARGRAEERARKRYLEALELAERAGDDVMIEQVRIRLGDLGKGGAAANLPAPTPSTRSRRTGRDRVPPGQRLVTTWPILQVEMVPNAGPADWSLRVDGACGSPLELSHDELAALPVSDVHADFHCVTGWSKLDNLWRGVGTRTLLERARPHLDATHVLAHADSAYTANMPLDVLMDEDALVSWEHNGADLTPEHGYPLRLVIPKLYGWKSVKWLRRLELLTGDRRGYWEVRGYHNHADPWREERYSYQEA